MQQILYEIYTIDRLTTEDRCTKHYWQCSNLVTQTTPARIFLMNTKIQV